MVDGQIQVNHLIGLIILCFQTQRTRFHTQIHILGDKNHLLSLPFGSHSLGDSQNTVVRSIILERLQNLIGHRHARTNPQFAMPLTQRSTLIKKILIGYLIQLTHKLTGVKINLIVPLFKLIQFLQYNYRYDDIIILKIVH